MLEDAINSEYDVAFISTENYRGDFHIFTGKSL